MKQKRSIIIGLIVGLSATVLAACSGAPAAETTPTSAAAQQLPTPSPLPTTAPTTAATATSARLGVSGIGEVKAEQDANLVFSVPGTVAEVRVKEGDRVTKDQVLAILDTRPFDQQIQQSQAQLDTAKAQQAALTESPRAYEVAAAQAQVQSAQAALEQVQAGAKQPDRDSAQAALAAAQAQEQSTRDQLSLAKTQAEARVQDAAQSLVQAQARYAQAKSDWEFVKETGKNPANPENLNPQTGKKIANKVTDSQREQYYAAFVQAEAALRQAEQAVQQAQVAAEQARQAEVVGIEGAQQQTRQAQAAAEKVQLPPDKDQLAAAQAALAQAIAARQRLNPNPTDSQKALAQASIDQAQAALELARLNREKAELRAPFDGVIATVNIDPGDPSTTGGDAAITVVDVSKLHVDVQISDIDIARVKMGQAVEVRPDALDKVFPGQVSYIAPTATVSGTIRTYLVRVVLSQQDGLRPGMSVRVDFKAN